MYLWKYIVFKALLPNPRELILAASIVLVYIYIYI